MLRCDRDRGAAATAVLTVDGTPAPKGSSTVGRRRNGTVFTRPASKGEAPWVDAVAAKAAVWRARVGTLQPPYAVGLTFWELGPGRPAHPHPSRHDLVTVLAAGKRWATRCGGEGVVVEINHPP